MTRTQQLTEATANRDAARQAMESAKTKAARRNAAEDLDFWQGKVAMLSVERGW